MELPLQIARLIRAISPQTYTRKREASDVVANGSATSGIVRHVSEAGESGEQRDGSIVLVLAGDEAYAMPLTVTLYSALVNLQGKGRVAVYLLDGGMGTAVRQRLRSVAERAHPNVQLEFIAPNPERLASYQLRVEGRFSSAVFLRLLIPELLPASVDKAIYLDSDTIVEADLTQLWEAEIGDWALLAVRERHVGSRFGLYNWRELGLRRDAPFFNSGILVLNLHRWRAESIASAVLEYLSQHRDKLLLAHDQEGLNAILAGQWGMLDPRWNVMYPFYDERRFEQLAFVDELRGRREDITTHPYIIHFNTADKPWHPSCSHPSRNRFFAYLKWSGWFNPTQYMLFRLRLWPGQGVSASRHAARIGAHRLSRLRRRVTGTRHRQPEIEHSSTPRL